MESQLSLFVLAPWTIFPHQGQKDKAKGQTFRQDRVMVTGYSDYSAFLSITCHTGLGPMWNLFTLRKRFYETIASHMGTSSQPPCAPACLKKGYNLV